MKKFIIISLALFVALAVFLFSLRPESPTSFEQSIPLMTEASGASSQKSTPTYTEISPPEDCPDECSSFKEDIEKHTYCRTVCGFTSEEGIVTPPTSTNPSLSNDYTLREEAIQDRDIRKCELISDTGLQKACQVRVTEDLLEK